jgi:membrane fusion protein (multidrug efflux system)
MFVRAVVEEGVDEKAILVPQQGVTRDVRGNAVAWVVGQGEVVEQRSLTLGRAVADRWLVTDGLAAGDRVIVDGLQRVRPGQEVHAVPAGEGAAAAPAGGKK